MKSVGVFFLSVIPILLSFRLGEDLRMKQKLRKAFWEFLSHVHFQIENFLRDQAEIVARFKHPYFQRSSFCKELQKQLENQPCGAFGRAWELHGSDFGFDPSIKEVLDGVAEHFGMQEKNAQLEELRRAIKLLEERESTGKKECENKIKILRISGLTAGLGILILLI